jgi:hypothetical protein
MKKTKKINISVLEEYDQNAYDEFLMSQEMGSFFQSNKYRKLLKKLLCADDFYLIAKDNKGDIIGVLPSFLYRNKKFGNVLNSLPFYGSNGGVFGDLEVKKKLLESFSSIAKKYKTVSETIISPPFDNDSNFYKENFNNNAMDERIGQFTKLPVSSNNIAETLMESFHYKVRNMIRKAEKNQVEIKIDNSNSAFKFLIHTHIENINSIGGIPKPPVFFELVQSTFESGKDYNIYLAEIDGKRIGALLLFYFSANVEYFTPVILKDFRKFQPNSLIIYQAMIEAAKSGFKWWNWGGTWLSQEGVYRFKKRWGTKDFNYFYYTSVNEKLLMNDKKTLSEQFPYFYICPFKMLNK